MHIHLNRPLCPLLGSIYMLSFPHEKEKRKENLDFLVGMPSREATFFTPPHLPTAYTKSGRPPSFICLKDGMQNPATRCDLKNQQGSSRLIFSIKARLPMLTEANLL